MAPPHLDLDAPVPARWVSSPDLEVQPLLPSKLAITPIAPVVPRELALPMVIEAPSASVSAPPPEQPRGSGPAFALATVPPPPRSRISPPPPRAAASLDLRDLGILLRRPLQLMAAAIGITLIDVLVTRFAGATLMIGPVRPAWIAGPLALAGVAFALWRIFGARSDE